MVKNRYYTSEKSEETFVCSVCIDSVVYILTLYGARRGYRHFSISLNVRNVCEFIV